MRELSRILNLLKLNTMKTKTTLSHNGDEARFSAAIANFEAREAQALERERRYAIQELEPSLQVHHLDADRYLVMIDPAYWGEWQFPKEVGQVEECTVSRLINTYTLFVRSQISQERLKENVCFLFLPF
jgi:hypothetical protein